MLRIGYVMCAVLVIVKFYQWFKDKMITKLHPEKNLDSLLKSDLISMSSNLKEIFSAILLICTEKLDGYLYLKALCFGTKLIPHN